MHKPTIATLFLFCFAFIKITAQGITLQPKKPNSSEIYEDLKKLNFLGSVLYIAAHPDDENTAAISYFANHVKANTTYLSLTRGDGGQNLIGPELRELLGVIRTQELLAARATDGGQQRFSRANDFGYSKHPDETLAIWNKKEVLSDVIWAIRTLKPDIIINRFDHRSPGTTHGHHTSSAILSYEAFDLANDKTQFPDQLKYTETWQPKRQFFNTSWWFYGSQEKFEKADKSKMLKIDLGTYYPASGLSNTEISALSRSQHRCQGFGNTGKRGTNDSYFELINGEMPKSSNIFEGIDTTWNRVENGAVVQKIIDQILATYDFKNPSKSIPLLTKAYAKIQQIKDPHWKTIKSTEIKNLITACAGLYLEAYTNTNIATIGDQISLKIEAINRSDIDIQLKKALITANNQTVNLSGALLNNVPLKTSVNFDIQKNATMTSAYWLTKKGSIGMYQVDDQRMIGKPETPIKNKIRFDLTISEVPISIEKPIIYKYNDRVKGEVYSPFEITPPVAAKVDSKIFIFSNGNTKKIPVTVTANKADFKGTVYLDHTNGWTVSPNSFNVDLKEKNQSTKVVFTVTPPKTENEGFITPRVSSEGINYDKEMLQIKYDHIPLQTLFLPSKAKVVRLDIKRAGNRIGYIQGAGDSVPDNLEQIGYTVTTLDINTITKSQIASFDAIVIGIRAYNVVSEMKAKQPILLDYVKNGGTLISQYNTVPRKGKIDIQAPYELTLSRDRVTDENSNVEIIAKDHSLVNFPNKLTSKDFEGWTQERGLYFPKSWAKEYTPVLSMHDKGDTPKEGSLLIAPYGKGHYIYTGLSFFRELPAGVSGAYKLFANMLSVGKEKAN